MVPVVARLVARRHDVRAVPPLVRRLGRRGLRQEPRRRPLRRDPLQLGDRPRLVVLAPAARRRQGRGLLRVGGVLQRWRRRAVLPAVGQRPALVHARQLPQRERRLPDREHARGGEGLGEVHPLAHARQRAQVALERRVRRWARRGPRRQLLRRALRLKRRQRPRHREGVEVAHLRPPPGRIRVEGPDGVGLGGPDRGALPAVAPRQRLRLQRVDRVHELGEGRGLRKHRQPLLQVRARVGRHPRRVRCRRPPKLRRHAREALRALHRRQEARLHQRLQLRRQRLQREEVRRRVRRQELPPPRPEPHPVLARRRVTRPLRHDLLVALPDPLVGRGARRHVGGVGRVVVHVGHVRPVVHPEGQRAREEPLVPPRQVVEARVDLGPGPRQVHAAQVVRRRPGRQQLAHGLLRLQLRGVSVVLAADPRQRLVQQEEHPVRLRDGPLELAPHVRRHRRRAVAHLLRQGARGGAAGYEDGLVGPAQRDGRVAEVGEGGEAGPAVRAEGDLVG
mmetsp:Transcript_38031/g.101162  ORF Transcript_38031/g.101162 Transcript_38031/m.101162 type:complete len:507 (-) Transcript_38031:3106-4626(-)